MKTLTPHFSPFLFLLIDIMYVSVSVCVYVYLQISYIITTHRNWPFCLDGIAYKLDEQTPRYSAYIHTPQHTPVKK